MKKIRILKAFVLVLLAFLLCLVGCSSDNVIYRVTNTDGPYKPVMAGTAATSGNGVNHDHSGKKRVALTFDDGPHTTRTKEIVDELSKYGFHATFFVVGNRVDGTEYGGGQAMLYAINAGNEIAVHGYTHDVNYAKCSDATYEYELSQTVKAIQSIKPGYTPKLMRPIGGSITDARVSSCPYSVIMWSVDSLDWQNSSDASGVQVIVDNVMSSVKEGDIILMHDIKQNSSDAAKIIIKRLYDEGYEIVTVSELLGSELQPGVKYSRAK